jgi:7-cyano-7-deazaguanine synthase
MEKILILYSGGADSRLMLELAHKIGLSINCLLINYDQLHSEELSIAKKQLEELEIPYQTVDLKNLNINSGLTGDGIKDDSGDVHEMYVPGRNTVFLSIALSIAESKDIKTIWLGCDWSDRLNLFPDCYQEYIVQINELFKIAGPKSIKVEAPLMGLSKKNIFGLLKSFGVDEGDIFSGYGDLS